MRREGWAKAHPAIRPEQAHSVAMTIAQSQSQSKSALDRLPVAERLGFCGVKVRVDQYGACAAAGSP